MRMSDRDAGPAIRARLEPLGRTALSIIYADKSEPQVVIKATGFWLDGEMYDHAFLAEDTSETFKREAAIYDALGAHAHILKSFGVAYLPAVQGEESELKAQGEREAWALKLERAPHGNLRERILQGDAVPMSRRLSMALDLADTLHLRGIPKTNPPSPERSIFDKELFALGTGICEITKWSVPYGDLEIEALQEKLMHGEYPHLSEDNPARHMIQRLWNLDYVSVQEVSDALRKLVF
ncbi:hypothetical protein FZEAL_10136 [Fusarium zealandicum]|uniref:Uncharacterized protein n=1 Tax=Fusarium zealandicum TaxID=1053134 RepID=A0A8H4U5N8_9HYPO|nr:hypothetical protein FZEAL_10136 [Fusarium zealandicum]